MQLEQHAQMYLYAVEMLYVQDLYIFLYGNDFSFGKLPCAEATLFHFPKE